MSLQRRCRTALSPGPPSFRLVHPVLHALHVLLLRGSHALLPAPATRLILGHAPLQLCLPAGGQMLPPAWVGADSLPRGVAFHAASSTQQPTCWLKGFPLCCWGLLPDLGCIGDGCHAEASASIVAACQRCCSGGLAGAWPQAGWHKQPPYSCSWPEPTSSVFATGGCLMRHYALRLGCSMLLWSGWWLAAADLQRHNLATGGADPSPQPCWNVTPCNCSRIARKRTQ